MKKLYLSSMICLLFVSGIFAQGNKAAHLHDGGLNNPEHYKLVAEQHRLVKTYLNFDAFAKIYKEVMKKVNVAEKDKKPFGKMLHEKYSLKDRYAIISKINSGELTESNIAQYLSDIKVSEYAAYYQGAYLIGKSSLIENAPQIHAAGTTEMESWLSSRLNSPVTLSTACGNIDYDLGNFSGWTGNYTTYNCTSPTPNIRNTAGINYTTMNTTTDQHGLCNGGSDPSVITTSLPCLSPFGGGAATCRLGDVLDGCGAADLTYSFTVNNNNTNFTYSYAVILYDGHAATDAPKVQISMKDLTTGQAITCAAYTIDATQGAGGANGYMQADPNNTLLYYKPWSQVYIPLLNYVGHNVQVTIVSSDCNGGAHRGYCYVDFTCAPLQLLSSTPMVCGGSTAVLTAPPGASTYSWSTVGSGNIVGSTTSQTVAVNQAGHYQVTLGSFGSGCTMTIDTIIPGGPTAPIASFTDNPGCYITPVNFTDQSSPNGGSSITSWTYTFGDGGTSNTQNPTHTYASPGTYTVSLSVDNGCINTYTTTITVTPGNTATITTSPVCLGSATSFTSTTSGNINSYSWNFGDGGTSSTAQPSHTYAASGSYVVTLTVSGNGGNSCPGFATQTVVVNPQPTVTATSNTTCAGGSATINAGGASTYSWNTGASGSSLSVSPASTTNYTVTGTDVNGCVNTATAQVVVANNPTVTVTPTTICAGYTGTLVANGCTAYTWSGPSMVGSTTSSTLTANPGTTSTYTVLGSIGSCTTSTTAQITVNPSPTPSFVGSTECQGTATNFTNNSTPSTSTYNWDFGDGNSSTVTSPTNLYATAGSYVVTLTVTAAGCTATTTNTITVKPIPALNPVSNISVCDQSQIAPSAFVSNPAGATVAWTNNNTAIGLGSSGTGNIAPFTGTTNGSTTTVSGVVTAIPTLNGCVGPPINFTLAVAPQPTVTLTSPPVTCPGQVVPAPTYTLVPNDPSTVFAWTNSNTSVGLGANGIGIPPSFTAGANNTLANMSSVVSVTPAIGTCVGPPGTFTITIYPTPVINPIPDADYCPSVTTPSIGLSVQPGGGTPSFTWFNSNTAIGLAANGNGSPIPSFTTANGSGSTQVGTISVSASLNGCPAIPVPFNITVNPNPVADFNNNYKVCLGMPSIFTDLSSVGSGFISQWSWNMDGNPGSFSTAQNPQTNIQPAGSHTITLTATTNKGCTAMVSKPVFINYIPTASFTGGGMGCPTLMVNNFNDASSIGSGTVVSWNWDFGNGAVSSQQNPSGMLLYGNTSPVANATYTVSLTVTSDSGCVSTPYSVSSVTVYPHPVPGFNWGPQSADIYDPTIHFYDQSIGASGGNAWHWSFGDTYMYNTQGNTSSIQNPSHTYGAEEPGTYTVTQVVSNQYGCMDSITKVVEIKPDWSFYIPNAFSPNGDGVNEGFKGYGMGIDNTTYNIWIFDRWGMQIWYASDINESWDGRLQGKGDVVQEDVYVWKVSFKDYLGRKHEYHGVVSLIK